MQAESSFLKSIAACYLQPPPGSLGGRAADKGPVTRHSQVYVCEGVGWTRDGTPHQTWPSSARTSSSLVVAALPRPKVYNSQGTLSSHLSRWLHSHLCSVFSVWPHHSSLSISNTYPSSCPCHLCPGLSSTSSQASRLHGPPTLAAKLPLF